MAQLLRWNVGGVEKQAEEAPASQVLLTPGQTVTTPSGEAQVVAVSLKTVITPQGTVELDLPLVTVQYLENGRAEDICICKLTLHNPEHHELLQNEVHRLWPPFEEEEEKEDPKERYEAAGSSLPAPFLKAFRDAENFNLVKASKRLPKAISFQLRKSLEQVKGPKSAAAFLLRSSKFLGSPRERVAALVTALVFENPTSKEELVAQEQVLLQALLRR